VHLWQLVRVVIQRWLFHLRAAGAENDFNRVILAIPKTGFKERRRPSSAAEIAAVSVRDNLFWVRPPSRQVGHPARARCVL